MQAGLHFVLENSPTARKHLVETMPGGVAVFDYDGDGRLDVFFANGASVPALAKDDPRYLNRLFRNEGGLRFRDVTEAAGLGGAGYSMAAAVADYDNDGDPDLYVGGVHRQFLYRNEGGRFTDVADLSGVASRGWVVGASVPDATSRGRRRQPTHHEARVRARPSRPSRRQRARITATGSPDDADDLVTTGRKPWGGLRRRRS